MSNKNEPTATLSRPNDLDTYKKLVETHLKDLNRNLRMILEGESKEVSFSKIEADRLFTESFALLNSISEKVSAPRNLDQTISSAPLENDDISIDPEWISAILAYNHVWCGDAHRRGDSRGGRGRAVSAWSRAGGPGAAGPPDVGGAPQPDAGPVARPR